MRLCLARLDKYFRERVNYLPKDCLQCFSATRRLRRFASGTWAVDALLIPYTATLFTYLSSLYDSRYRSGKVPIIKFTRVFGVQSFVQSRIAS